MNELPEFLRFTRKRKAADSDSSTFLPGATTATTGAPPRKMPVVAFDPATEPAIPDPVAPRTTPTHAGPEVTAIERRRMGFAPLPRNARGETVGRPEYDDTGDRAADLENYRRGLSEQRNPADRDGRVKSALKEAAFRFLNGGGIVGAVTGAIHGAVAPNIGERRQRNREIQRVTDEQAQERAQQDWYTKMQDAQAGTEIKLANAEYLRARPGIEADRNELRVDIAREGFETRKAIAGMQDATKRSEGAANRTIRKSIADQLTGFRKTALYAQIKEKQKDRNLRASEGAKNRASREGIAARAQEGANSRAASAQAGADRRSLSGLRFGLVKLATLADKEKKSLEELVNEIQGLGGEVFDDEQ